MVSWEHTNRTTSEGIMMTDTPKGFLVFTGKYEVHYSLEVAEERLEELLDAGHEYPTVIKVDLTENNNSEPLGLTAKKVISTSSAGEIR